MLISLIRKSKPPAVTAALRCQQPQFSTESHCLSKQALESLVLSRYHRGKFRGLLSEVVAAPSVLLTACQSLRKNAPETPPPPLTVDSVSSNFFSLQELSFQLCKNSFDFESCCIPVSQGGKIGTPLVLPNLKLKVVIEAIRIVLEVIYDDRFATFCYGGRANLGRHTAIRYLKNSVANPSWWFTVKFDRELFHSGRIGKLFLVLEEKIEDNAFLDFIKRLFECKIVSIELGGVCIGRGLPQESVLSSILINIYFSGFDKEIQELRLRTDKENFKFKENDLVSAETDLDHVFYRPLKIYAVRYLDEILIITSGTKMMTLELKSKVVKFLEHGLDLRVDKLTTVIHSAVDEKIDFLGMELQAVAPSVLRPPKTEKAIRARKKYLRQKEVRLLELKNAKERNRRKLGMKLLKHVFRKLKQRNGFEFEFQIENEVRQIFRTWGNEVVNDFLGSVDERAEWHRKLSAGDFLSLERIRNSLPRDLVDAYDNFQLQVDKHLKPIKAKQVLEEEVKRAEEEDERKYAKRTIDDLTRRCIKVDAPIELIRKAVRMVGFTNSMGRPRPLTWLMVLEDIDIIKWYAGVGRRWLDFYCCCHNFRTVKITVTYHLRFSCILTLAEKHEATKRETIRHFTKDLKVLNINGVEEVHFPSEKEIKMMGDRNLSEPIPADGAMNLVLIRLASDEPSDRCIAHFCDRSDTTVYRIQLPQSVQGCLMGSIHQSLHRKCAPLCCFHASELYMGRLTLQDIDCTALFDFY
ncbi:hypothetical protein F511_25395 [Dorcoceras hygrometricum]|uniref:Reverse transcriptase domain-containing protein n=1 Tax=Dorcoceras hygrometricum TaxID=472368 RepID=A0A2Z7A9H9_9LAMI|nr:hypothetical protein F511_25395 [Dorcoceras hygrometricum]